MKINKKNAAILVAGVIGLFGVNHYVSNMNPSCDDVGLVNSMQEALLEAGFQATLTDIYEVAPSMEEVGYTSLGIPKRARVCAVKVVTKNTSEDHVYAVWAQNGDKWRKGVL